MTKFPSYRTKLGPTYYGLTHDEFMAKQTPRYKELDAELAMLLHARHKLEKDLHDINDKIIVTDTERLKEMR